MHVPDRSPAHVREVVVPFDVCEVPVRVTDGVLANVGEVVVLLEQGLADIDGACVVDSRGSPYDRSLFHGDELQELFLCEREVDEDVVHSQVGPCLVRFVRYERR